MTCEWFVTGADGMLGRELVSRLKARKADTVAVGHHRLDITDGDAVRAALDQYRPAVVANCAAWTDVDAAESHEAEALDVNGHGPAHLAEACRVHGTILLHISTDYVFSGDSDRPYWETDTPAPRTAYGRTKLVGERAVLSALPETGHVVRTAWLYGAGGGNFVQAVIRLEAAQDALYVVDDQRGQPTWTGDVADRLILLGNCARADTAPPGVYHATNSGQATWNRLAREVLRLLGADPARVHPVSSAALPRPAPRPAYSVLGHSRWSDAGLPTLRHWCYALVEAFPELRDAERRRWARHAA
ncbi:dTDP-4-dehydrorhamnose reductase [Streptomyces capitiformicae]|uniref:dTDP-4-dehydrorhamnose reductase n=1 Tax=Streptomyces capitiformicae TaxID=2014920 RepID=A0A918ZI84_9ACTN|nr:dTDP-4-dehydrorhamnose reductase [Streptomyces capitiformicae]GHE52827.1 NAD(P)-dependent oxidoreductase [Streptomyces capitiformicae]